MKCLKKVIAMAIVATMVLGLCVINVSAAELTGFNVMFKNASGEVVTSAKAGATLSVEVYIPAGTYTSAGVTLVPNKDAGVAFSNLRNTSGIAFSAFNILTSPSSVAGRAQAKFTNAGGVEVGADPYFAIDVTIPEAVAGNSSLDLFTILNGSNVMTDGVMYTIPTAAWSIMIEESTVPVESVSLNEESITLEVGKTETLTATVLPEDATNKNVTWESSDESIATVEDGVVTAKAAGTATITVTTEDGDKTDECTVEVTDIAPITDGPLVKVEDERIKLGKDIEVPIVLEDNEGFADLSIEIGYDREKLTLVGVTENDSVGGTCTQAETLDAYPYNISWTDTENVTFNGTLATLQFELKDGVAEGFYSITIDYYKGRNGEYIDGEDVNYDQEYEPLNLGYKNGTLEIFTYLPGDINGDGKVNNKDGTHLLRYLANWTLSDLVTDALDVNGDGTVNNKDGTHLLRYLANWAVELN